MPNGFCDVKSLLIVVLANSSSHNNKNATGCSFTNSLLLLLVVSIPTIRVVEVVDDHKNSNICNDILGVRDSIFDFLLLS